MDIGCVINSFVPGDDIYTGSGPQTQYGSLKE